MKKILTVSLFAMMAVSAANADIASTKYVTDRTGTVSFTANGIAKDASNLTEAINLIDSTLKSTSDTLTGDITGGINELKRNVEAIEGSAAMTSGITKAKVGTYDGYSALITTAQQQADKGVADAATAQAKADANETAIGVINNETTGILAQAKADAKTKADKALEDAKTYTDGQIDTLEVSLGTTAGDLSSLTTRVSTAEGNITSLQSDKADKTYVNTELGKKQNNLSADQLAAVNSGVTDKVVKSVETHTNDINTIKASDVMKSGVTADVVAKAKSAMQEANLKALESWTTGQCAEPTVTCSLISKGGKIAWEVVTY